MSTKMRKRGGYHHGDLRSAVLQAAGEILEKEGLSGLSLREAARRAGVSHNAPYRHFADRESLLAALAAEVTPRSTGDDRTQRVQRYVADWRAEYAGHMASDATPMRPERCMTPTWICLMTFCWFRPGRTI